MLLWIQVFVQWHTVFSLENICCLIFTFLSLVVQIKCCNAMDLFVDYVVVRSWALPTTQDFFFYFVLIDLGEKVTPLSSRHFRVIRVHHILKYYLLSLIFHHRGGKCWQKSYYFLPTKWTLTQRVCLKRKRFCLLGLFSRAGRHQVVSKKIIIKIRCNVF